jgi:hypothetical protein
MPIPQINHFLSPECQRNNRNAFCIVLKAATARRRSDMKIYLLIMLIGTLLTAIHFTSTPERQSETLPQ